MNGPVVVEVEYIPAGYSKCTKCGEVLPLNDDFFRFVRGIGSYRTECKECERLYHKQYHKENPEVAREGNRKRRALKAGTKSDYKEAQWEGTQEAFDWKCAYCGKECKLEKDHVLALSKGGEDTVSNIVPACRSCNSSKGNRDVDEWYERQTFHSTERHRFLKDYLDQMQKLYGAQKYMTRGEEIASFLFFDL